MKYSWKWLAANAVVGLCIAATVAVAAPSGGGGSTDGESGKERNRVRMDGPGPHLSVRGPGQHLSALAKELGVSRSELRKALEATRDEAGPPPFRRGEGPPSRSEMNERCKGMTDALAEELDRSGDEVRAAIKAVAKAEIEKAVDDDRLTRAQADRVLERLNDAACLPALGPHGPGGPGCGPGGRHGPPGNGAGMRFRDGSTTPQAAPTLEGAEAA